MYKCLKKGWLPYKELLEKYNPAVDQKRLIFKLPSTSKIKLGRDWVVKEKEFVKYIGAELKND